VKKMLRKKHPGADERKIMFEIRQLFDRRKKAEMWWALKWKKERDRFFGRKPKQNHLCNRELPMGRSS
jgi:hypothetical protein